MNEEDAAGRKYTAQNHKHGVKVHQQYNNFAYVRHILHRPSAAIDVGCKCIHQLFVKTTASVRSTGTIDTNTRMATQIPSVICN